ncbi:GIN domain-containing protein [Pedobacter sp. MW01-1-1]|uniref:GIN domain-containing protein n=1 Tax=Pedobacter sp. MW01-1-1 TaxID=3383027 RepID=UPI003FED6E7A
MKTSIKTFIASSLTAIILSTTSFVGKAHASDQIIKSKKEQLSTKKVVLKGNVEVLLVQSKTENVSYAEDNIGIVKATKKGDILTISSTGKNVAKVIVYVNDIYRIDASENAVIKTDGELKTKYLQIILKDKAVAEINTASESLYTVIKGNAELILRGKTDFHTLEMDQNPKLTIDKFAALQTEMTSTGTAKLAMLK